MANYATVQTHRAYLNTRFGVSFAQAWLGLNNDMLEAIVGRYSRGKRKGQLRGAIEWKKVERGGWMLNEGGLGGHVEFPGIQRSSVRLVDAFTFQAI